MEAFEDGSQDELRDRILYYEDRRLPYRKMEAEKDAVIQPSLVGSWGC